MNLEAAHSRNFPLARRLFRVLVIALMVIFFFGALIVPFEVDDPNTTIHNYFDGIWWASTTVSTVGYGDKVPVTVGGKILGMFLQLTGAAIFFGALVGTITVYLHHAQTDYRWKRLHGRLDQLEKEHKAIHSKLDFLVKNRETSVKKPRQWGL
jgi:voltage-gated potassium channel